MKYIVSVLETVQDSRDVEVDVPDGASQEVVEAAAIKEAISDQSHAHLIGVISREVTSVKKA